MASHKILFIARDAARALAESYFSDGRFGKDGGGADDVEIEVNGSYWDTLPYTRSEINTFYPEVSLMMSNFRPKQKIHPVKRQLIEVKLLDSLGGQALFLYLINIGLWLNNWFPHS